MQDAVEKYLNHAPLALAIRELNRIAALRLTLLDHKISSKEILDVGCGDGFWWETLKDTGLQVYGIDISERELKQAKKRLTQVELCDISQKLPFQGKKFDLVIGNCSLEHIPNLSGVLSNLNEVMNKGALFVLFVPTPFWAHQGFMQKLLNKISPRISMAISGAFNGFFQHWHLYDHRIWQHLLQEHGFMIEKTLGLGNKKTDFLFRLFLPTAFLSFLFKTVFGVYPSRFLGPIHLLFRPFANILKSEIPRSIQNLPAESVYEYMLISKKIGPS